MQIYNQHQQPPQQKKRKKVIRYLFTSECWHLRQLLLKSECERARSPDSTGSAVAVAGEAEQTVVQTQICFSGASPRYITAGCIHPGQHFFFSNCTTALLFGAASCLPHLMQTAADCVEVKSHHGDDLFVQHDDTFQEKHKEFPVLFFLFSLPLVARRGMMKFNWDYFKSFFVREGHAHARTRSHNVPVTLWCKPRAFSRLCQQFDLKVILSYRSGLARGRRSSVGIDHLK